MELTASFQGFVYELASKVGIIRSLLYRLDRREISTKIKNFKSYLHYLNNIGTSVLSDDTFKEHKPIIKSFILQSVIGFLDDLKKIKNENNYGIPVINVLYWDDFCSSIGGPAEKEITVKDRKMKLHEIAQVIVKDKLLPEDSVIDPYGGVEKGDVEKTDFLMDLSIGKKRILYIIDFKNGATHQPDSTDISSAVMDIYASLLNSLRAETIFDVITVEGVKHVDIGSLVKTDYERVREYFNYFKLLDKHSEKFIQAVCYATDYINRQKQKGITYDRVYIKPQVNTINRLISVKNDELNEIYKLADDRNMPSFKIFLNDYFADKLPEGLIEKFIRGSDVNVKAVEDGSTIGAHETLKGGKDYSILNLDLRKEHTQAIEKLLNENKNLLLVGNPGIGKTYAVIDYMSKLDNGFCLYASPRVAVNLDFARKVAGDGSLHDPYGIVLTTNSRKTNRRSENNLINYIDVHHGSELDGIVDELNKYSRKFTNGTIIFENAEHAASDDLGDLGTIQVRSNVNSDGIAYQEIVDQSGRTTVNNAVLDAVGYTLSCLDELGIERKKVYVVATIQALRVNALRFFEKLEEKIENIDRAVLFIDEVTGDPSGPSVVESMISRFGNVENTSVIVGDASLSSALIAMYKFKNLAGRNATDSSVIISKEKPTKGVRVVEKVNGEPYKIHGHKFSVVEVNSFPASEIDVDYVIAFRSSYKSKAELIKNKALSLIKESRKPIIYVQSKPMLQLVEKRLKREKSDLKVVTVYSSLSDKDKKEMDRRIRKGDYDVALITSSSARGLSYPESDAVLIDFQSFDIESGLMEAVQTAFRIRGKPKEKDEIRKKKLVFTIVKRPVMYDSSMDVAVVSRKKVMDVLLTTALIRNSIFSRIGVSSLNSSVVPLGHFSRENTIEEHLLRFIDKVSRIARKERQDVSTKRRFVELISKLISGMSNTVLMDIDSLQGRLLRICDLTPLNPKEILKTRAFNGSRDIDVAIRSGDYSLKELNGFTVLFTKKKESNLNLFTESKKLIDEIKKEIATYHSQKKISDADFDDIKSIYNALLSAAKRNKVKMANTTEGKLHRFFIAYPSFAIFMQGQPLTLYKEQNGDRTDLPSLIDGVFKGTFFTVSGNTVNGALLFPDRKREIQLEGMSGMQIREFTTDDVYTAYKKRKESGYVGKIFTLMEM